MDPKKYKYSENMNDIKDNFLQALYNLAPFNLKGDLKKNKDAFQKDFLSCLICASNRPDDLDLLLFALAGQSLDKNKFEVVIINDGGGQAVRDVVNSYQDKLGIVYKENSTPNKIIGFLRNETIAMSKGEYILFLDDDTRIIQKDFLEQLFNLFKNENPDVIIPLGQATFGILKLRYDFFDPYSFGNAGVLYKRDTLEQVGGFKNSLKGYEDIELGIRMTLAGAKMIKTDKAVYLHPPFYFDSMRKPIAIGQSIQKLRNDYSFWVWLIVFFNALRFLPYGLIPNLKCQQWFKISYGVLLSCFKKEEYYY